jgi:hypothetical protein
MIMRRSFANFDQLLLKIYIGAVLGACIAVLVIMPRHYGGTRQKDATVIPVARCRTAVFVRYFNVLVFLVYLNC